MSKYVVNLKETFVRSVIVDAESKQQAVDDVLQLYYNEKIVLGVMDFSELNYDAALADQADEKSLEDVTEKVGGKKNEKVSGCDNS